MPVSPRGAPGTRRGPQRDFPPGVALPDRARMTFRFGPLCRRRRPHAPRVRPSCELLEDRSLPSVSFVFDYSLDASNFFNTQQKRDLLEAAGRLLTDRLEATLTATTPSGGNRWRPVVINPATGEQQSLSNLSVPAGTIILYAGGRDLAGATLAEGGAGSYTASGSQTWLDTVQARGQPGALGPEAGQTDYAPSVASISFDTAGTSWYFGANAAGIGPGQNDFLSVAVHELGHVLGFGTSPPWARFVAGDFFSGPASVASFGGPVPLAPDHGHWAEGTQSGGTEAAMDPSLATGLRKLFTDLDFSALKDIGWMVTSLYTPAVLVTPTSGLVTTEAGGTATFTVVLNTVPSANVTISLSSSNPSEGSPSVPSLTFTPANALTPQTVTITGVPDNRADGDVAYTIVTGPAVSTDFRYSGVNPADVAVTNLDDGTSPPPPPAGTPAPGTAGVTDVTALLRIT